MAKNIKTKQGFTIIEVVLVLAIAGLIFLMVFIAFPALQRSQKDTQRQNDISRLSTQITNFKTNNTNGIPGSGGKNQNTGSTFIDGVDITAKGNNYENAQTRGSWAYFYLNYLLAGGDIFEDPDGTAYSLDVVPCSADAGKTECKEQRYDTSFEEQGHAILVTIGAKCDGEAAVQSSGARDIALVYKYEGGGTLCLAN